MYALYAIVFQQILICVNSSLYSHLSLSLYVNYEQKFSSTDHLKYIYCNLFLHTLSEQKVKKLALQKVHLCT